jgi:SAM-dependent methyltransferase
MRNKIADHYSFGGLRERIETGLAKLGTPPTVASLGPVDEFHVGGRLATAHLIDQLGLDESDRVLDIGCGLGGTARYIASATGAQVTGVDLTREYIEVATWLTELVGLDERATFVHASAADMPQAEQLYTAATMVHVGMNIPDKAVVFADVAAQLASCARFAIYDLMVTGEAEPQYPVPWAASQATSALETAAAYQAHLQATGFEIEVVEDRTEAAMASFEQLVSSTSDGLPPLGLHLVMGPTTPTKFRNLVAAVRNGIIAPTEIIARRV